MPKKKQKRPFIDDKNAQTFKLVHRSQKDPMLAAADETGGDHVLVADSELESLPTERTTEQRKFGIYFDDDYDYLQHLRNADEIALEPVAERLKYVGPTTSNDDSISKSELVLPSSVFETGAELETGLLDRAIADPGPHPEWDPDIVAALDDDFDFDHPDNCLDDDFVIKANDMVAFGEVNNEGMSDDDSNDSSTIGSDEDEFGIEETKSRFTSYSVTSSVIRRTAGLKTLDAHFEKIYEDYDDTEMGDLAPADDDIKGFIEPDSDRMEDLLIDYAKECLKNKNAYEKTADAFAIDCDENVVDVVKEVEIDELNARQREEQSWDCESILSTYSNLYNRPTLIQEPSLRKNQKIELDPKTGLPIGVIKQPLRRRDVEREFNRQDNSNSDDDTESESEFTTISKASTFRPKNETSEERRERKRLVKEERKVRRAEKKMNKSAFKSESTKQHVSAIQNAHQLISSVKIS